MDDGLSLRAEEITKSFGGARALKAVSFECLRGEVHALLGENGAGKSTLIKILTGALTPDDGAVVVDGEVQDFRNPNDARAAGVGVVYQDFHLFGHLTVAENICAASEESFSRGGLVSRARMNERASELLASLGIDLDPRRRVGGLDAAERKLIEIARALERSPRYLFLDEPTAALEPRETHRLLEVIHRLRDSGTGVILVTHRLGEVIDVADRASALRDGAFAGVVEQTGFSGPVLAALVVGEAVAEHEGPAHEPGDVVLDVRGVRMRPDAAPVEFAVRERELVAVIGLVGSGVSGLLNALGGVQAIPSGGAVTFRGRAFAPSSPQAAQNQGIGFVSQDRKEKGIVPMRSCAENIALPSLRRFGKWGFASRGQMVAAANTCQSTFAIKWSSPRQPVSGLSGGNQQKVVLGRWLVHKSDFLIIQEPSQGVDIGARQQIHKHLVEFAAAGGSVLFSSSDLDEVRAIAHRIVVMHAGEVVREFDNSKHSSVSRTDLTQAMADLETPDILDEE